MKEVELSGTSYEARKYKFFSKVETEINGKERDEEKEEFLINNLLDWTRVSKEKTLPY